MSETCQNNIFVCGRYSMLQRSFSILNDSVENAVESARFSIQLHCHIRKSARHAPAPALCQGPHQWGHGAGSHSRRSKFWMLWGPQTTKPWRQGKKETGTRSKGNFRRTHDTHGRGPRWQRVLAATSLLRLGKLLTCRNHPEGLPGDIRHRKCALQHRSCYTVEEGAVSLQNHSPEIY